MHYFDKILNDCGSVKLFQQTSTHNTRSSLKWNAEFINIIHYTHPFPAMKCLQGKMSVAR